MAPKKTFLNNLLQRSDPEEKQEKSAESSHKKAEKILQDAVLKAENLLNEVELITDELRGELKVALVSLVKKNDQMVAEMVKQSVETMLADFKTTFEKESLETRKKLQENLASELIEMKKQLDDAKQERIAQFEKQLIEKANTLAQETIGRALSSAEQEKLVLEALEKAKRDGFFTLGSK